MKKLLIILLLSISGFMYPQVPIIVSKPQDFQKYIIVRQGIRTDTIRVDSIYFPSMGKWFSGLSYNYTPENLAHKGQANGYPSLDETGQIPLTQIPSSIFGRPYFDADLAAMLNNSPARSIGDVSIRLDSTNLNYMLSALPGSVYGNWKKLNVTIGVLSIGGQTGNLPANGSIVGLGNVVNSLQVVLADSAIKYVTPTQLNTKEPKITGSTSDKIWHGDKTWGYVSFNDLTDKPPLQLNLSDSITKYITPTQLLTKQNILISGSNIKTINGSSILGSGNLSVAVTTGDLNGGSGVNISSGTNKLVGGSATVSLDPTYWAKLSDVNKVTVGLDRVSNNLQENFLDVPSQNGMILSSTTLGTRSWINFPITLNDTTGGSASGKLVTPNYLRNNVLPFTGENVINPIKLSTTTDHNNKGLIDLWNTNSNGYAQYISNEGNGYGIRISNNAVDGIGYGIYENNNKTGIGYHMHNTGGGVGFEIYNTGTTSIGQKIKISSGKGFQVVNNSDVEKLYITSDSTDFKQPVKLFNQNYTDPDSDKMAITYGKAKTLKGGGSGTVTSVTASGGLQSSGGTTPNISPANEYAIPTTTQVNNWNTAYGWGNPSGVFLPIAGTSANSSLLQGRDSSYIKANWGGTKVDTTKTPISGHYATQYDKWTNTVQINKLIADSVWQAQQIAGKQNQLNGTGFIKASGTTISYDNSTYIISETDPIVKSINGIIKSNGSTISAASGSDIPNISESQVTNLTTDLAGKGTKINYIGLGDTSLYPSTKGIRNVLNYDSLTFAKTLSPIINLSSWSNTTGWTKVGAAGTTFTASSGKLIIASSQGSRTLTDYLRYDTYGSTNLDNWQATTTVRVGAINTTSFGFAFGLQATGATNYGIMAGIKLTTATLGTVFMDFANSATNEQTSNAKLPISAGDYINFTLIRDKNIFTAIATNTTQSNKSVSLTFRVSVNYWDYQALPIGQPNVGQFAIYALGGSDTLSNLSITSPVVKNGILFIGDSHTSGSYVSDVKNRFTTLLQNSVKDNIINLAQGGNQVGNINLAEVDSLAPKKIFVMLGTNEISANGVATGVVNFKTLINSLKTKGFVVGSTLYVISVPPVNSMIAGVKQFNDSLKANYSAGYIDIYYDVVNAAETGYQTGYSYDNIHGNDLAHFSWYKRLLPYLNKTTMMYPPLFPTYNEVSVKKEFHSYGMFTGSNFKFFNLLDASNNTYCGLQAESGTNVATSLDILPRGTGAAGVKSQFLIFGTDYTADGTNYDFAGMRHTGTLVALASGKSGSGTSKDFMISAGYLTNNSTNANQLYLKTDGNIGIYNSSPAAVLDITSTTSGILIPRMTNTQRDAIISPAEGMFIYSLTDHALEFYNGTVWKTVTTN